ncbi:MAG: MFS transporter [Gammaproteobacteria bacterium]|nr:MFS transporter [Gammaproteobacteria bacterium]
MLSGFSAITATLSQALYRTYAIGNGISLVGLWIQRIAVGWLTWDLTHSGAWLGLIAFADLCPALIVGPLGGVFADRWDRLRIIFVAQSLAMLQAALLFGLTEAGLMSMPLLFALVLAGGVVMAFNQPARLALVPSLVGTEHLPTAVAINSIVFNLARFVGPAIAGVLILRLGVGSAFAANALSYLALLIALVHISRRLPAPLGVAAAGKPSLSAAFTEGFRHAISHPGIAVLLFMAAAMSIGTRPLVELMPGIADGIFARGAAGLATLASAVGIGAILGGLWLAGRGAGGRLRRVLLANTLGTALCTIAFVLSPSFEIAIIAATLYGASMVLSGISVQTMLQLSLDGAYRGRVMSLYGLVIRSGPALGALLMGLASELMGLRVPLLMGCVLVFVVWIWVFKRRDRLG